MDECISLVDNQNLSCTCPTEKWIKKDFCHSKLIILRGWGEGWGRKGGAGDVAFKDGNVNMTSDSVFVFIRLHKCKKKTMYTAGIKSTADKL